MTSLDRLWAGWRGEYVEAAPLGDLDGPDDETQAPGGRRCVFCEILSAGRADTESFVVWRHRGGRVIAILNAYPYTSGHVMVMPTRHVGELSDLDEEEAAHLWSGVRQATAAVTAACAPDGVNLGANLGRAAGAGIPGHLHIHVLPRWTGDTNFMTSIAGVRVLPEALTVSAEKIRSAWAGG